MNRGGQEGKGIERRKGEWEKKRKEWRRERERQEQSGRRRRRREIRGMLVA